MQNSISSYEMNGMDVVVTKKGLLESNPSKYCHTCCCQKACGSIRATLVGNEIHKDIVQKYVERDYFIGNTLVYIYANYGSLAKA